MDKSPRLGDTMKKVLFIISGLNYSGSFSLKLGNSFVDEYKKKNPKDTVETLDLNTHKIRFYDMDDHSAVYIKGGKDLNKEEAAKSKERNALVDQFMSADKIVLVAPMWNFSIPAVLKAYIDMIIIPGRTFAYTKDGVEGLVKGKKIIFFGARGGMGYDGPMSKMEMQIKYLENVFGFIGIKDQKSLVIEGSAMPGADTKVNDLLPKIKELAHNF